ncbi:MAG: RNA repair transcriptional activator RtcR family protein [Ignavibacteria bacterium]|nr:RNA repair transcriptional activator RtcR family protein [Ignavibacteria bacterium]
MIKILVSFVGTNDAGKLNGKNDGAILTVLKNMKFDRVHLLWTSSYKNGINYDKISQYLINEIKKRKYCKDVTREYLNIEDVVDHNEIYPKLLDCLKRNFNNKKFKVTAAIASGTPSMQACWIIMAESGDFPMELIRSNEPELNKEPITKVKLGTALPKIIRLENENKRLKKSLYPSDKVKINIIECELKIGEKVIPLPPMQFCYYRYFITRVINDEGPLKIKGFNLPREFSQRILEFFTECYPEYDYNVSALKAKLSKFETISLNTFRSNISRMNSNLRKYLVDNYGPYLISYGGHKFQKEYSINIPKDCITIIEK